LCGCNHQHEPDPCEQLIMDDPVDKIWAHRINSLEYLDQRVSEFRGIEVDIFYEPNRDAFTVKHDLDSGGPDLEQFIDSVRSIKKVLFWFDYKNLNEDTENGVSKLASIVKDRNLQTQVIVESYYAKQLQQFAQRIQTSYWVGSNPIPDSITERDQLYESEYKKLKNLKVEFLSSSFEMFEFLTHYFPEYHLNLWMSGELDSSRVELLRTMASTKNVNIILIDGNENPLKTDN
jgi:hypothetical protein